MKTNKLFTILFAVMLLIPWHAKAETVTLLNENFDSYWGWTAPANWKKADNGNVWSSTMGAWDPVWYANKMFSSGSMCAQTTPQEEGYLYAPAIEIPDNITKSTLTFNATASSVGGGLEVSVDGSVVKTVAESELVQDYNNVKPFSVDLSSYAGQTIIIAFKSFGNPQGRVYVDDILLTAETGGASGGGDTGCPKVSVEVSNITTDEATFTFTTDEEEGLVSFAVTNKGADPNDGDNILDSDAEYDPTEPYTMEDLEPATAYDVHVKAAGCDAAEWVTLSFTTEAPVATVPYPATGDDAFEADVNGWRVAVHPTCNANQFVVGTAAGAQNNGTTSLYVSKNGVDYEADLSKETVTIAYRKIQLAAGSYHASYDWKNPARSIDYMRVLLTDDPLNYVRESTTPYGAFYGPTDIALDNGELGAQVSWTKGGADFVVERDTVCYIIVGWVGKGNDADNTSAAAIDNFKITTISCSNTTFGLSEVTATTASFSIDKPAFSDKVEFIFDVKGKTAADCDPANKVVISEFEGEFGTPKAEYVIKNLTGATEYVAYIRTVCESGESDWSSPVYFTTKAAAATVPYSCDFEDNTTGDKAAAWGMSSASGSSNKFIAGSDVDAQPEGSAKSLYISNNGADYVYSKDSWSYISAYRKINFEGGKDYQITFDWKCVGNFEKNQEDYMRVYIITESEYDVNYPNFYPNGSDGISNLVALVDGGTAFVSQSEWAKFDGDFKIENDGDYFLVFGWRTSGNSGEVGTPAAIDNIEIKIAEPGVGTGVENNESALVVYSIDGTIYADGEFEIFDVTGRNFTEMNGSLASGVYVVRSANATTKVVVK